MPSLIRQQALHGSQSLPSLPACMRAASSRLLSARWLPVLPAAVFLAGRDLIKLTFSHA